VFSPQSARRKLLARIGRSQLFIVRTDEILTAFMELQTAIHKFAVSLMV